MAAVLQEEKVVIVGAGIAGLATSLALHRLGIKSLVLESAASLRITGFALGTWTNAWRALDALGLGDGLRLGGGGHHGHGHRHLLVNKMLSVKGLEREVVVEPPRCFPPWQASIERKRQEAEQQEREIIDSLVGPSVLKDEVMKISPVQNQTRTDSAPDSRSSLSSATETATSD
ncbi:unnamed protein product [Linum tenue]|uniref:FAD-binding domain-containing protein n=1 Tax=Linum tenue TaxID=586396 RepID=A0AAV0PEY5_9ROSI|nr:unnamed protein product [Linum tenue]